MLFQDPILERLSGQDWQNAIDGFMNKTRSFIGCQREALGSTVSWEPRFWGIPLGRLTLAPRPGGGYELAADPRGGSIPHPPDPKFDQLMAELDAALVEYARRVPKKKRAQPQKKRAQPLGLHGGTLDRVREARELIEAGERKTKACKRAGTDPRTYDRYALEVIGMEDDDDTDPDDDPTRRRAKRLPFHRE